MADVTPRLAARVRRDFAGSGVADAVIGELRHLDADERVLAAVVIAARGAVGRLDEAMALARLDWRDLLVATGLADGDWPRRLEAELGPSGGSDAI